MRLFRIRSVTPFAGFLLTVASVATALAISELVGRILTFTYFLAAVTVSARFAGTTAGLFGMLLSIIALTWVLGGPAHAYGVGETAEYLPRVITFSLAASLLIWMSNAMRKAEIAVLAAQDVLEERVRERTAALVRAHEQLMAEQEDRKRATASLVKERTRARARMRSARFHAMLEERTRIAREIHDTLLQGFTGVSLQLLATIGRVPNSPESQQALREVLALAQKTLADARQAVWDMRPPELGTNNFVIGLRLALERIIENRPINFDYRVRGSPDSLDTNGQSVIIRVAQEAVRNVIRHAEAQTVRVVVSFGKRHARLIVDDDGRGFTVDDDVHAYGGRWGLLGMRERAAQLHGRLKLISSPGHGTKVMLSIPYHSLLTDEIAQGDEP